MKSIKITLFLLIGGFVLQAQTASIKGKILTNDGYPAENVSVVLVGIEKKTVSNQKGEYLINQVAPGKYTLKYSFVGLQTL